MRTDLFRFCTSALFAFSAMLVHSARTFATSALLLTIASCSSLPAILPATPTPPPTTSTAIPDLEREIVRLVNRHRQARGLGRLTSNPTLDALAREHSNRMARGEIPLGHDGLEDRYSRADAALTILRFGENVATNSGYPAAAVPAQMVDGWIASPGHRASIEGRFQLSGVGIARSASGAYFGTQIFAE